MLFLCVCLFLHLILSGDILEGRQGCYVGKFRRRGVEIWPEFDPSFFLILQRPFLSLSTSQSPKHVQTSLDTGIKRMNDRWKRWERKGQDTKGDCGRIIFSSIYFSRHLQEVDSDT